tara:strand:- start:67 stop:2301 length:2235 start_codon:yes stop_codon:yes gene_type:complete
MLKKLEEISPTTMVSNPNPKGRQDKVQYQYAQQWLDDNPDAETSDDFKKDVGKEKEEKPKKKKPMKAKDRKREERVVKDLDEINKETDPIKRHEKMKEKAQKRREEIYNMEDLPPGTEGSTLGEMGGGMALEDLSNDPNVSEDDWVEGELKKMEGGKLLKKMGEKNARKWLKIAYQTGKNELNEIQSNPKYNAKKPQKSPFPTGHIMDYHGQRMVRNELEKRLEQAKKDGDDKAVNHYTKQLGHLDKREETDTGVLYETKDGMIGFKHTSNKASLSDPHSNKSISSKAKSMNESADRQKERGRFSEEQIEKSRKAVQESSKRADTMVRKTDRQSSTDMNKVGKDKESRESLRDNASGFLGKLPGASATKGSNYANKVRKKDGYGEIRTELKEMGIENPQDATDSQIFEAMQNILKDGGTSGLNNDDRKIMSDKKEGEIVDLGGGKYAKMVMIRGKLEPRTCDESGLPVFQNDTGKLVYKLSEMVKTMREKSKAKTKPKGWKSDWPMEKPYKDKDLEQLGKEYTPPLSLKEMKWIMESEEADGLENTNEVRKRGMDAAHQEFVSGVQNSDKELDGYDEDKNGNVVDKDGNNGPATQQYVDSFMEDMHWNLYIDGDHDGVGDMSIGGKNVAPPDFRKCLAELSQFSGDPDDKEELKKHLRNKVRINAKKSTDSATSAISGESKDAHISFDAMVPDERRGREKGAMRPISVGEEAFRSKGVGVNSVVGGLGLDMQKCLSDKMDVRNK